MRKDCIHRIGKKLLFRLGKYMLIAIIGYITWTAVVSEGNEPQAEKLYREGKEFYEESKGATTSHYIMYDDSSYLYIKEKEK